MTPSALRLALVALAAPAIVAAAPPKAAERAVAQALGQALGQPARFRHVQAHGDVVCGEAAAAGGPWRGFYTYAQSPAWSAHVARRGLSLTQGLACFDRETGAGRRGAGGGVCRGYDFVFYFAYDHFCR